MKAKINNIILLTICLLFFLLRGKANKKPNKVDSILVIPVGKLGDVICTTPVFRAIRKYFPNTKIFVENIRGVNKLVLNDSSLVDGYLELQNIWSAIREIKRKDIDTAILTGPSFKMLAYIYLAGVPFIVVPVVRGGHCPQQTKTYHALSKFAVNTDFNFGSYAPRERLRTLEPLGIIFEDTKKKLSFSNNAKQSIDIFFHKNDINTDKDFLVGVTLSAGNKIKMWGVDKFAKVIDYLYKKHNAKIIITGNADDKYLSQEIRSLLENDSCVIDTAGIFNIDELKALISRLNMFIGVDTGPIYIAEAFDIPTIDIVGPMDEKEQPPRGILNRIVVSQKRIKPVIHIMNAREYDKKEAEKQIKDITSEMVIDEIELSLREMNM